MVAGDVTIDYTEGDGIVSKVDVGGTFVVDGIITITGGSVHPVLNVGDGYIVAGGIVVNSTLYSTKDVTTQKWAIGPSGITGQNFIWCLANSANDCWIHPYTNDFTIAVNTVVRSSIDHHELNTTGYGDGLPHTITLDAGCADNGQLYIAGTGKVVVNSVPTATSDKAAYSGGVTVTNTATLAINAGKQLTSGTITFAAGTTLEVPSSGVEMGAIAFSGERTVTLKVSGGALADGDYALVTSAADLPAGVASRFTVDAQTESRTCLYTLDNRSLRLAVGETAIAALPCIWTGAAGDGKMDTAGNWLNDRKPETVGAAVLIPSEAATIDNNISGFAPSSITFGNGSGAVTIAGNPITGLLRRHPGEAAGDGGTRRSHEVARHVRGRRIRRARLRNRKRQLHRRLFALHVWQVLPRLHCEQPVGCVGAGVGQASLPWRQFNALCAVRWPDDRTLHWERLEG